MLEIIQKSNLKSLKKGDLIDLISPSSPISRTEFKKIVDFLAKYELKARFFLKDQLVLAKKPNHLFSLDRNLRFKQLKMALTAQDSSAIWCVRGGYASSDLIEILITEKKIAQNKLFIGFSDLTSLGGFLARKWGWKIIYGSILTQLSQGKVTKKSEKLLLDFVFGKRNDLQNLNGEVTENSLAKRLTENNKKNFGVISYELDSLNKIAKNSKNIEGELVGGCCAVIFQTFSTVDEINFQDKILLLEDIYENGERLDRFFEHFLQVFVNKKQIPKAILLGNFTQFIIHENKKKRIRMAIEKLVKNIEDRGLEIAVFEDKEKSIGHSENNMMVIIGHDGIIENGRFIQIV